MSPFLPSLNLCYDFIGLVNCQFVQQPFGFACREALRRLLVGREIAYSVEYTVPSGRDFGTILLAPNAAVDGERNVAKILLRQGWVKTRTQEGRALTE